MHSPHADLIPRCRVSYDCTFERLGSVPEVRFWADSDISLATIPGVATELDLRLEVFGSPGGFNEARFGCRLWCAS